VDSFINPRFFNPGLGTMFFVGGNYRIGQDLPEQTVHAGFARDFGAFYLGLYYGGRLVNAVGGRMRPFEPEIGFADSNAIWYSQAAWNNNIAVLVGLLGMGFRLDFVVSHNVERFRHEWIEDESLPGGDAGLTHERDWAERARVLEGSRRIALTWGANLLDGGLFPWVRLGYEFATSVDTDYVSVSDQFGSASMTRTLDTGGAFDALAGARLRLGDASVAGATLRFTTTAGARESYAFTASGVRPDPDDYRHPIETPEDFSNRHGGMTGFGLLTYFQQSINLGQVAFGIRPTLDAGMTLISNSWYGDTVNWQEPGYRLFTLRSGVDLGVRMRPSEESRVTFFAGTVVRVFNWNTWNQTGGNDGAPTRISTWSFFGIEPTSLFAGNLSWGMTFNPTEDVVVALGLNSVVGAFFNRTPGPNVPTIDLTVSMRLPGNGQ